MAFAPAKILRMMFRLAMDEGTAEDCVLWLHLFPDTFVIDSEHDEYYLGSESKTIEMRLTHEPEKFVPQTPQAALEPYRVNRSELEKALASLE